MRRMERVPFGLALIVVGSLGLLSAPSYSQTFHEDFNGNALNPLVWSVDPGDGEVIVASGVVTLTCSGLTFPVVTTLHDPFPAGDFRLRVGIQYLSVNYCGDGFGAMDNFWEDYNGVACRPFLLWQANGGLGDYTGSSDPHGLAEAPELGYHVYEWDYMNGTYELFMDGVPENSGSCAPHATQIFFGHPHPIGCGVWTTFAIDFIDISPIGATRDTPLSWGKLKLTYR